MTSGCISCVAACIIRSKNTVFLNPVAVWCLNLVSAPFVKRSGNIPELYRQESRKRAALWTHSAFRKSMFNVFRMKTLYDGSSD